MQEEQTNNQKIIEDVRIAMEKKNKLVQELKNKMRNQLRQNLQKKVDEYLR